VLGVVVERRAAVPQAGAAMYALSRSKTGTPPGPGVMAWPEHISMHILAVQRFTEVWIDETHMIGKAGRRLHLSAD